MILVAALLALAAAKPTTSDHQASCLDAARLRSLAPGLADGAARMHAFQNAGSYPLRLVWAGLDGKHTQIDTVPPGEMRSVSTWLGHAFVLTDPKGRCVRAARVGNVMSGTYVGISRYRAQPIREWHVFIDVALTPAAPATSAALATLDRSFGELERTLPRAALAQISRTPIFLHEHTGIVSSFHPEPSWLVAYGRTVEMTKGIEIPDAEIFVRIVREQPGIVLHELPHAYHDSLPEADRAAIEAAYRSARARGLYRKVDRNDGTIGDAYALADPMEYFAELSEAWFIRNDYVPYTRSDLETYDPEGAALVARLWR